jgi:lysine 6-dehydrogenase
VNKQRDLFKKAENAQVTIIPDLGLAPGLVSIITKDIVDQYSDIEYVKIRGGGLPLNPQPPLNYQIVFSPNGLINEYVENALVLDHGCIREKPSMTEREMLEFPEPFGKVEAFLTSGGCSTLPYTYKDSISYLDYKTIRYPGHCEKMKTIIDMGFASNEPIRMDSDEFSPRDMLIALFSKYIPSSGEDAVLLRVYCKGVRNGKTIETIYECIDYFDKETNSTAMMRMTGIPVSISADLIAQGAINKSGVFCAEEIIPPQLFFKELKRRNIRIQKTERIIS